MISQKHKFIFIHAPKTAGTSIEGALIPFSSNNATKEQLDTKNKDLMNGPIANAVPFKLKGFKVTKHTMFRQYIRTWTSCLGDMDDYFKFGNIRNPWDRAISYYFWKCGRNALFSKKKFLKFIGYKPLKSFYNYFVDNNNSLSFDFYIRFENLQQDFDVVCDKIGIPRQKLPHVNKSKHKHYTEYYDDETRQIVAERYAKDIEYFNYEFGE